MDEAEAFNDFVANTSDNLFGDDDDDEYFDRDYYDRDQPRVDVEDLLKKRNAKHGPFSTSTFWLRTENTRRDLKNHLWDFMVYNNIREHSFNNYKSRVEMMNSELVLNIVNCKKILLNMASSVERHPVDSDAIEASFDSLVSDLLKTYGIRLREYGHDAKSSDGIPAPELKRAEERMVSNKVVHQLIRQFREYRAAKDRLVKAALYQLLKSFNEFRNKVLQEVYQDSKGSRMDLTRFIKNIDKVTSRFDFSGEFRFHNLRTYFKYKEQLDNYIENYVAFNKFPGDFTLFVNTFNPNTATEATPGKFEIPEEDSSSSSSGSTESVKPGAEAPLNEPDPEEFGYHPDAGDIADIFEYMGGVPSQNYLQTQEPEPQEQNKVSHEEGEKPVEKPAEGERDEVADAKMEDDAEDLKLLEEARKKAAAILRLKRIQRTQAQEP